MKLEKKSKTFPRLDMLDENFLDLSIFMLMKSLSWEVKIWYRVQFNNKNLYDEFQLPIRKKNLFFQNVLKLKKPKSKQFSVKFYK